MKKIFFLVILLPFLIIGLGALAQNNDLPSAGITPDSNFYFLKTWKESIQVFFTFGAENKAKQFLHLAEVRLAEYQKMVEKGKIEVAQRTLEKYEKQLNRALGKTDEAKDKGKDVEKLKEEIGEKILRHQEVLAGVLEKAPEQAKPGIKKAIEASQKGFEKTLEAIPEEKLKEKLGRKPEEIQKTKIITPSPENISVTGKGWAKTFGGDFNSGINSVQQTSDGGYIATGWIGHCVGYPSGPNNTITIEQEAVVYLLKTDVNGNKVWEKLFGGSDLSYDSSMCDLNHPEWAAYEATGHSVQQTSDGGYIITGMHHFSYGKGGDEVYLIKTDANGDMQWNKTFDGEYHDEVGYSVQQTSDGGYFIVGMTTSYGVSPFSTKELQVAPQDIYLIKTDANGNKIWKKVFGGTFIDMAFSGQQTSDGGYIIAGLTVSRSGKEGIYRKASGVLATEEGDYIYAGCLGGHIDNYSNPCDEDMYLLKIDADGNKIWEKTFGMKNNKSEAGYSIQQTSDGGYIIVGQTLWYVIKSDGAVSWEVAQSDVYLVKTDAGGNKIWEKTLGGDGKDYGYSVRQTSDGGYIVAGFTDSFRNPEVDKMGGGGFAYAPRSYLIKTDSNGNKIWERIFFNGSPDGGGVQSRVGLMTSVQQTSDKGYIVAAGNFYTYDMYILENRNVRTGYDAYLIKTDENGNM